MVLVDLYGPIGNNKLGKVSSAPGWVFFEEGGGSADGGHKAHRTYCSIVTGQRFHNETACATCELHRVFVLTVAAGDAQHKDPTLKS